MIPAVRSGIYALGTTITGLTGGFWWIEAPQETVKPYAVFSQVADPPERDTTTKFENIYFQINFYAASASALETIVTAGKAKFEDSESTLSISGYNVDRIERQFTRDQKLDEVFQTTIQYKLELTKL